MKRTRHRRDESRHHFENAITPLKHSMTTTKESITIVKLLNRTIQNYHSINKPAKNINKSKKKRKKKAVSVPRPKPHIQERDFQTKKPFEVDK